MPRLLAILFLCAAASAAAAAPPERWQPVDQDVGDLDRLAVSLRQMETGLRSNGEQTSLYAITAQSVIDARYDRQSTFYRVGPGFLARTERLDYAIKVGKDSWKYNIPATSDGRFLELIGPNTVFQLKPPGAMPVPPARALPQGPDYRIEGRLDGRIDGRAR